MTKSLLPTLALCCCFAAAAHANCRANLGGIYAFSYGGHSWEGAVTSTGVVPPHGIFHNGLAYLNLQPNGDFSMLGTTSEQEGGIVQENLTPWLQKWRWLGDKGCELFMGNARSGINGIVSSDGNMIVISLFPPLDPTAKTDHVWGTAVRTDE